MRESTGRQPPFAILDARKSGNGEKVGTYQTWAGSEDVVLLILPVEVCYTDKVTGPCTQVALDTWDNLVYFAASAIIGADYRFITAVAGHMSNSMPQDEMATLRNCNLRTTEAGMAGDAVTD